MIRFLLLSILLTIVMRAASQLWTGVVRGLQGHGGRRQRTRGANVAQTGVHMVRDPVCGTFVVPDHAVALSGTGGTRVYFCSAECRDTYRARPATPSASVSGRTA
jgi:YHS domain-containing protein